MFHSQQQQQETYHPLQHSTLTHPPPSQQQQQQQQQQYTYPRPYPLENRTIHTQNHDIETNTATRTEEESENMNTTQQQNNSNAEDTIQMQNSMLQQAQDALLPVSSVPNPLHAKWYASRALMKLKEQGVQVDSGPYSHTEDMRLRAAVHNFFNKEESRTLTVEDILWRQARSMEYNQTLKACYATFWEEIGAQCPNRPLRSIWHRLRTMFHPSRVTSASTKGMIGVRAKNEAWSEEFDEILMSLVPIHGHSWLTISEHLGRTPQSCKDRYSRLTRATKAEDWNPSDDLALINRLSELSYDYFEDIDWEVVRHGKWHMHSTTSLKEKVEELISTVPAEHSGSLSNACSYLINVLGLNKPSKMKNKRQLSEMKARQAANNMNGYQSTQAQPGLNQQYHNVSQYQNNPSAQKVYKKARLDHIGQMHQLGLHPDMMHHQGLMAHQMHMDPSVVHGNYPLMHMPSGQPNGTHGAPMVHMHHPGHPLDYSMMHIPQEMYPLPGVDFGTHSNPNRNLPRLDTNAEGLLVDNAIHTPRDEIQSNSPYQGNANGRYLNEESSPSAEGDELVLDNGQIDPGDLRFEDQDKRFHLSMDSQDNQDITQFTDDDNDDDDEEVQQLPL